MGSISNGLSSLIRVRFVVQDLLTSLSLSLSLYIYIYIYTHTHDSCILQFAYHSQILVSKNSNSNLIIVM